MGSGTSITPEGAAFFKQFYVNFLATSLAVAEHFRDTDMQQQVTMLQKSFYQLVSMYAMDEPTENLKGIARTHSRAGHDIEPALYDLWMDALLRTVEEFDSGFDADVALSWRLALAPGVALMKHYYST